MKPTRVKKLNQHVAVIKAPAPDGKIHLYYIDADRFAEASKYTWSSRPRANGTTEAQAFAKNGTTTPVVLQRLIAGAKSGQQVAFRDGNTRNCRKENLRTYESLGERLKDFHVCQVPLLRKDSNVSEYKTQSGPRFQGHYFKNGKMESATFDTKRAAQEWVLSEKAALCEC